MLEHSCWYALEVVTRKESQVAQAVADKGYECFLPLFHVRKTWSDRVKVTPIPLFRGYVFSRFDARFKLPILVTPGVRDIVSIGRIAAPIPDSEIEAIQAVVRGGLMLEPCEGLHEGDPVIVTVGPLCGVEGKFLRYRGRDRLMLSISLIQRSVAVEIDRLCVKPLIDRAMPERLKALNDHGANC
jgi:transcription antitermination factor NusG